MNLKHLFARVKGVITAKIGAILSWCLDDDFKRMCVLAIIHAKWCGGKSNEERYKSAAELNQNLGLVTDANALKFPTVVAQRVLRDVPSLEAYSDDPRRSWISIQRAFPCWLAYGHDQQWRDEVAAVFAFCYSHPVKIG